MTTVFNLGFAVYFLALLAAVLALVTKQRWAELASVALLVIGVLVQTVYMGMRWHVAMRAPFSNMFESLVLFAWATVVVYLFVRARICIPALGAATALAAVLTLAYASKNPSDVRWVLAGVSQCQYGGQRGGRPQRGDTNPCTHEEIDDDGCPCEQHQRLEHVAEGCAHGNVPAHAHVDGLHQDADDQQSDRGELGPALFRDQREHRRQQSQEIDGKTEVKHCRHATLSPLPGKAFRSAVP